MDKIINRLIILIADIAKCKNMPSEFYTDWDFPKNVSKKLIRIILRKSAKANKQCKDWANILNEIRLDIQLENEKIKKEA